MELWVRARRAVATESADWVAKPRLLAISEQALRTGESSSTTRTRSGGRRSASRLREGLVPVVSMDRALVWVANRGVAGGRAAGGRAKRESLGKGLGVVKGESLLASWFGVVGVGVRRAGLGRRVCGDGPLDAEDGSVAGANADGELTGAGGDQLVHDAMTEAAGGSVGQWRGLQIGRGDGGGHSRAVVFDG